MFKFIIDDVLNPYLWPSQIYRLPKPVARFLGGGKPKPVADYWIWLETFVSTFACILTLEAVFNENTVFARHNSPLMIASYGASAVLSLNVTDSVFSQPRNLVFGQFIPSLIGICLQKLFLLSAQGRDKYWIGAALSVAILSVAMSVLNCLHPPGGASALLPFANEQIRAMGWWYLPAQLTSSAIMLGMALIFSNIWRSYPIFWWSPGIMGQGRWPSEIDEKEKDSCEESREGTIFRQVYGLRKIEINDNVVNIPNGMDLSTLEKEWIASLQHALEKFEE